MNFRGANMVVDHYENAVFFLALSMAVTTVGLRFNWVGEEFGTTLSLRKIQVPQNEDERAISIRITSDRRSRSRTSGTLDA